ncbi:MAG: protein kinase [Polyangiaceae bacterium]|nr:protein kinase [Polyangiaceae bacterium]
MAATPMSIPELELLDELGRGATSVVYRARRKGRLYAVKLPHEAGSEEQRALRAERFRREAVALARVRHPALPEVMEVGEAGGRSYLVMELVAGEALSRRLERGPLNESQSLELGRQVAGALVAIHQAGLVHSDLKPANILFEPDSARIRVVDFGFATEPELLSGATGSGYTRAYAAPEQLTGRDRVDGRADLFALGCVLYESLAGKTPFGDAESQRLLRQHASVALPVLSDIVPGIRPDVSQLILRLLAPNPNDRYPTAVALLDDIARLQRGESIARRVSTSPSWRVAEPRAGSTATGFVGRASDLELLGDVWLETLDGHGRLVVLGGLPGVGKTRLVMQLLAGLAPEGPAILFASCEESDPRPFSAVRQLLEGYLYAHRHVSSTTLDEAENHLRALAGDFAPLLRVLSPMLSDVFRDVAPLPGADEAHKVFVEGLADFIGRLLRDVEPAAVFVDNAQWLDSGSRRVLARAAHHLASSRVLLLFASRTDFDAQETIDALTRGVDAEHLLRIEIRRLDPRHVGELVRAYLGGSELDPDVLRCVESLSDGTPLSVLELVRTMVDSGALTYYWGGWKLDREVLARLLLPSQTAELLVRRIQTLEPNTQATLAAAAVVGSSFSDDLLAAINEMDLERTQTALAEARRTALVESSTPGAHRFVHDTVREALLAQLGEGRRRATHQRIAEALDWARGQPAEQSSTDERTSIEDMDRWHLLATHYAQGEVHKDPGRVFETCVAAGQLAFRSFDNERALRFFESAASAALLARTSLSPELDFMVAEARLRTGALEPSLERFEHVLDRTNDPILRAQAHARIAHIHEATLDTEQAWSSLIPAFRVLGEQPPTSSFRSVLLALVAWLGWVLLPPGTGVDGEDRRRLEAVCALYHQAARLALQCTQPVRFLVAALASLGLAQRLGPSSALALSYQWYALVLVLLGMREAGLRYLDRARIVAASVCDPAVHAYLVQVSAAALSWAGDIPGAVRAGAQVLDEYGHWRELSEYCITAYNQQLLESVKGRAAMALHWAARALQRMTQHEGAPVVPEYVVLGAKAALVAAGRDGDARGIVERLDDATVPTPQNSALVSFIYGPRVAAHTEAGQLGEHFEAIVEEVRHAKLDPRRVHLGMAPYYVHVAHARVHQCLRASSVQRQVSLPLLREATRDLGLASRLRLLKGHHLAVRGCLRWLEGNRNGAKRDLEKAEVLGHEQEAPWVLYAVHRGRAHMLREQGHTEAARDEARMAEALARTHQAVYRLRWIREEFDLRRTEHPYAETNPLLAESEASSLSSVRAGQLRSVLQVAKAPVSDLDPERQAPTIVDELVRALRAERGFLFLCAPSSSIGKPRSGPTQPMRLVAARDSSQHDLVGAEPDLGVVQQVVRRGTAYIADPAAMASGSTAPAAGARSTIAAPLVLEGTLVGVVYLDRRVGSGEFSEDDAELLNTLACQVPLAIELVRSLSARGRLEEYERTARKMEAVSRLAGGIAHDFNNMLAAIRASTEAILADGALSSTVVEDARTIRSATDHAEELTRQLLAFSRSQHLKPEVVLLGGVVQRAAPVLRRLLGTKIELKIEIERELYAVKADRSQLERVLTNLVTNARDAMPEGGQLTISVGNETLSEQQTQRLGGIGAGPYAVLTVADTGQGIDPAIRDKLFEPFFTTKTDKGGTGLGLATSYGIVTQSGGAIDVESELGQGTTFRVYVPKTSEALEPQRAQVSKTADEAPVEPEQLHGTETLLVVEDEPLVNHAMCRVLQRKGYRIMTARGGNEAMKLAHENGGNIQLLITDVMMPDMNGLELARELRKLKPDVKVLYTSGFSAGALEEGSIWGNEVEFLQKPVHPDVLVRHVRLLLDRG